MKPRQQPQPPILSEEDATCAISYCIMQHPVRARFADGAYKRYELKEIYQWIKRKGKNTCPLTRRDIVDIDYDYEWRHTIDFHFKNNADRYKETEYKDFNIGAAIRLMRANLKPKPWIDFSFFNPFKFCMSIPEEDAELGYQPLPIP